MHAPTTNPPAALVITASDMINVTDRSDRTLRLSFSRTVFEPSYLSFGSVCRKLDVSIKDGWNGYRLNITSP